MISLHSIARHCMHGALALALTCVGGLAAAPASATTVSTADALMTGLALVPAAAATVVDSTVNLSAAPPDLNTTVDPNIVITFDDSGSMAWDYMGDYPPWATLTTSYYGTQADPDWNDGPWYCANVLDPSASSGYLALAMNGVYYNPNTKYVPPLYADGSSFPQADATLKSVWYDGVSANRPRNPGSSSGKDFTGTNLPTITTKTDTGSWNGGGNKWNNAQCSSSADTGSCACIKDPDDGRVLQCTWTETSYGTDNRWTCPADSTSPLGENGGPYYYTYTGPALTLDAFGNPDATSISNLYTASNWTAVAVPADQYQNWANWYAYYRDRNMMTRTALSRVFGQLGGNIRVAWQNINSSTYDLPGEAIIANLLNTSSSCSASSVSPSSEQTGSSSGCYRDALFNWIFSTGASGGTPDRGATKRAGSFFSRTLTKNALDPYWNGKSNTSDDTTLAADLSCRQNYHMLVTDGYWNGNSGIGVPDDASTFTSSTTLTLPDGTTYDGGASTQTVIYKSGGDANNEANMTDIAFYYWSHDLQPDLDDGVTAFVPDKTTDVTGTTALTAGDDPLSNKEIYWNPKNDPATWQHVVQFMVTLGINGYLHYSEDTDCSDSDSDACHLRKGETNSTGSAGWPKTTSGDGSTGSPATIDDMWHAALASRGSYFSASNPTALVDHLTQIFHSISDRAGSAVANTVNSGVWTSESVAYKGTYNSADWSGSVTAYDQVLKLTKDADGNVTGSEITLGDELWDANCLLTGDGCKSGSNTISTARDPDTRVILTSSGVGADKGVAFQWDNLSASEQQALNADPATDRTDATVVSDGHGQDRLDWLRGDRSKEGTELRSRGSVMGAVIRSQPLYVAYPDSGYRDQFPASGSSTAPENASGVDTYETFVSDHKDRKPMLYVGANDGMLHALDAATGEEKFAYVPASVYWRSPPVPASSGSTGDAPGVPELSKLTAPGTDDFTPTVDNTPVQRDVFFNSEWHTILVGTLGMGGRGVYALDITDPDDVTESAASDTVLWEFNSTSTGGANMGYTYGQPEIARLATGKWAVLVPGGYFPQDPLDPNHYVAAAGNKFSSLFVLDAETGALIKELKTSDAATGSDVTSFGLSTPVLGDYDDNQVDDVAFAGDLMGNMWRFDISSSDTDKWQIDLVYEGAVDDAGQPTQPITVKPRLFPDPTTNQFMVVFGTGKYLGTDDRLKSGTPTQAIYGIREQGASTDTSSYYPVDKTKLVKQTMSVDSDGTRWLSDNPVPGGKTGWSIDLPVTGERVVQRAGALFTTNQALMTTLIPAGDDPCNPSRTGAQVLISAVTGGGGVGLPSLGEPVRNDAGEITKAAVGKSFPPSGTPPPPSATLPSTGDSGSAQPVIVEPGGCRGVTAAGLNIPMSCWRRRSWRVLLDGQ
ncbi:MAG TPA: PilC/PilY family type IV pilus protein [Rhodanobacteraceae bacterium]|nr:PilC/PilY family type IV pilus protein [Rhodanobacteraceae bacterium]